MSTSIIAVPKLDILSFLAMPDQSEGRPYSRQTHGLGDNFDIIEPIDVSGYGKWIHVKGWNIVVNNKQTDWQGFPYDAKLYDNFSVYDWITERTWQDGPRAYKKFVGNRTLPVATPKAVPVYADGMIQFPRWINATDATFDLDNTLTDYITVVDCKQVRKDSLGKTHVRLRGPFLIDHGLVDENGVSIGPILTLIYQYYWNNVVNGISFPTLEENYFGFNFGWISWKLQQQDPKTGLYLSVKTTSNNKIVKFNHPAKYNFPCF